MRWAKASDPFYHLAAWRKVRAQALERDHYMCARCVERFLAGGAKPRSAEMVHHIIPREQRPDLALTLSNLESLCNICHNKEHPEKGSGKKPEKSAQQAGVRIIKI